MALTLAAGVSAIAQAGPVTVTRSNVKQVDAQTSDYMGYAFIGDNGDGTAAAGVFLGLPDGTFIDGYDPANVGFFLESEMKPGQAGKGTYSGSGHAIVQGTSLDPVTLVASPVTLEITIDVAEADEVGAFVQQGINVHRDNPGEVFHVQRQHYRGNQAWSMTCGSMTIAVDGVVVVDSTAGYGGVTNFDIHSVERFR